MDGQGSSPDWVLAPKWPGEVHGTSQGLVDDNQLVVFFSFAGMSRVQGSPIRRDRDIPAISHTPLSLVSDPEARPVRSGEARFSPPIRSSAGQVDGKRACRRCAISGHEVLLSRNGLLADSSTLSARVHKSPATPFQIAVGRRGYRSFNCLPLYNQQRGRHVDSFSAEVLGERRKPLERRPPTGLSCPRSRTFSTILAGGIARWDLAFLSKLNRLRRSQNKRPTVRIFSCDWQIHPRRPASRL